MHTYACAHLCVIYVVLKDSVSFHPRLAWWLDPVPMYGGWQWGGAGWWFRIDQASGWEEWTRQGGFTRGEGGHRSRPPREEGCILQIDLPFTANNLCRAAACPHAAYVAFQAELEASLGVTLKTPSST